MIMGHIYKKMHKCKKCYLSALFINELDVKNGFGKLPGIGPGKKYMLVMQNPSGRRFAGCDSPIAGNKLGFKFKTLLEELKVWNRCYITNLVKCSTIKNKQPLGYIVQNCMEFLEEEIHIIKPKKIIALGSFVYDILSDYELDDYKGEVYSLKHPAYYFHYNRSKINEYKQEILEVLC